MFCTIFTHPTNNSGQSKSKLWYISQHSSLTFAINHQRCNLHIWKAHEVATPVFLQADSLRISYSIHKYKYLTLISFVIHGSCNRGQYWWWHNNRRCTCWICNWLCQQQLKWQATVTDLTPRNGEWKYTEV